MVRDDNARVAAFEYKGRCWRMDSVQSYFRFNMDILDTQTRKDLFSLPVYTKVRDEMPAHYGEKVSVANSLVADGCVVGRHGGKLYSLPRRAHCAGRACEKLHHHAGRSGAFRSLH